MAQMRRSSSVMREQQQRPQGEVEEEELKAPYIIGRSSRGNWLAGPALTTRRNCYWTARASGFQNRGLLERGLRFVWGSGAAITFF
jgi:hypothetical protein